MRKKLAKNIKGGTKNKYESKGIFDNIINSEAKKTGPLFASNLYNNAYEKKEHPNNIVRQIKENKELLKKSKDISDKIDDDLKELNRLKMATDINEITKQKNIEQLNMNNFKRVTTIANMFGNVINNVTKHSGNIIQFVIKTAIKIYDSIVTGGQGIILKILVLIIIIVSIFVGFYAIKNYNDINSMSFMNMYNDFLITKDPFNFWNDFYEYLYSILPNNFQFGIRSMGNNFNYMLTGQNLYDKYLIDRAELPTGHSDNIFHIDYYKSDNTVCTIKPKPIILNYNDNNYINNDYKKLDYDLRNNMYYYKYYYIPVNPDSTGKYVLDIDKSTYNNSPTPNSNINSYLDKYKLFKINSKDNNIINLNSFNNIFHNTDNTNINKNINSIYCYSAYGIYLVNPNYSKLNVAIIDINFNLDKFKEKNNLIKYISDKDYLQNIYYVKISPKNPNYAYVTKTESDNDSSQSLNDLINNNKNNTSILKLYNQVEEVGKDVYDLKFKILYEFNEYRQEVNPPLLKLDEDSERFYIDFNNDENKNSFLMMDKEITGSINPIYEISVNPNDLNYENFDSSDNYFLLFPSLNVELLNLMKKPDFKYKIIQQGTLGSVSNFDLQLDKLDGKNTYYIESKTLENKEEYNAIVRNMNNINGVNKEYNILLTFALMIYFTIQFYSYCCFYINTSNYHYGSGKGSGRTSYNIYLISDNITGGNVNILGPRSGLNGQDWNEWIREKIFKIDITKYANLKNEERFYNNKSIQYIGSSPFKFGATKINDYFTENGDYINQHFTNGNKIYKNLYLKTPKNFRGKLYSLIINKYPL